MTIGGGVKKLISICIIVNVAAIIIIGICVVSFTKDSGNVEVVAAELENSNKKVNNNDFIKVTDVIPDIVINLRYATENNITGKVLYTDNTAYLRYGTAVKLKKANDELKKFGYRIEIWDAYRPRAVQFELWKKEPDARYIVDPNRGSIHSRGAAIDITLVNKYGNEIEMPTDFDTFSAKGDRDYSDVEEVSAKNAMLLQNIMLKYGFVEPKTEWWHFSDSEWKIYSLVDKVSIKNNDDNINIDVVPSEDKKPDLMTLISDKIKNFDMDGFAAGIKYQFSKIKNIFGEYRSEE